MAENRIATSKAPHGIVFVPFLGDFLSMEEKSRNVGLVIKVFVPFLGDFLSMAWRVSCIHRVRVFVPFLGGFLSIEWWKNVKMGVE